MNNIFNSFINSITPALLIPLLGTILGSACVFFMGNSLNLKLQKALQGFASGVMVAASIWSLLLPAFDLSSSMGKLSFIPAVVGFWVGIFFLLSLDHLIPHLHLGSSQAEGVKSHLKKTTMMIFAVTIHNLSEGMAVGVVYAGFLSGNSSISAMGALSLALGIVCSKRLLNQAVEKSLRTHNPKSKKGAQVMRKNEKITALYERLSRDDFGKDDD
ncbi:ZIP family metal transporter [Treponema pectinovorum]|nr:ZIP family metal transporter [Treponema pectinovorum]